MTGPSLDDLIDELARGRVYECNLRDPAWVLDGLTDGDTIYIDPRPAIVDTVLHECLHRLKPRWGERAVRRHTAKLMQMDERSLRRVWRAYQRVVKRRRAISLSDYEP